MKVLILSCNTGEGHNSAARSIKEEYDRMGIPCQIEDALRFGYKGESRFISGGHSFIYKRLPKLFGVGYYYLELRRPHKTKDTRSFMYRMNVNTSDKLWRYIRRNKIDTVVCVHLFPAFAMSAIREKEKNSIRTYFVSTDYTCYPGVNEIDMDGYFIPHKDLIWEFVACGVPAKKLIPTGLPVSHRFEFSGGATEALGLLELPHDEHRVLLMCGSMGCGPVGQLVEQFSEGLPERTRLIVICGRNKKLKDRLEKKAYANVTVVGYTDKVDKYMDVCNLLVTKAGGLSSTEAARKGLPIVYMDAVPGCETKNLVFFCSKGYAVTAYNIDQLCPLVCELLTDKYRLSAMRAAMTSDFPRGSARSIAEYTENINRTDMELLKNK